METATEPIRQARTSNRDIARYYDENQILYDLFWSRNALHYGLWDERTRSLSEAVRNTNRAVCDYLEIVEDDSVLDAGCGVGGVSLYIAETRGARVSGITLSATQLRRAHRNALRSPASHRLGFSRQDFTRTAFRDGTFTRVFGIESVCHATRKLDFLREAHRVLRPGGRIAVVDAFLVDRRLDAGEREVLDIFLSGWAVPNLSSLDSFRADLERAGFGGIWFHDRTEQVRRSSDRIRRLGLAAYPLTLLLSSLRVIPRSTHLHTLTSIRQGELLRRRMVAYGVFVAEKPADPAPQKGTGTRC